MVGPTTANPLEVLAIRGEELYRNAIEPKLSPNDVGLFAAIDLNSGEFELDRNDYLAVRQLRLRLPSAEIWLVRVGSPAACRIGRRP
jgi:hypothetical protein